MAAIRQQIGYTQLAPYEKESNRVHFYGFYRVFRPLKVWPTRMLAIAGQNFQLADYLHPAASLATNTALKNTKVTKQAKIKQTDRPAFIGVVGNTYGNLSDRPPSKAVKTQPLLQTPYTSLSRALLTQQSNSCSDESYLGRK